MKSPEASLTRLIGSPGYFQKAVIEAQVVPQRVLPTLRVVPVEGKMIHNKLVNFAEREHLLRRALYGHCSQRYVGVRRLSAAVAIP